MQRQFLISIKRHPEVSITCYTPCATDHSYCMTLGKTSNLPGLADLFVIFQDYYNTKTVVVKDKKDTVYNIIF